MGHAQTTRKVMLDSTGIAQFGMSMSEASLWKGWASRNSGSNSTRSPGASVSTQTGDPRAHGLNADCFFCFSFRLRNRSLL